MSFNITRSAFKSRVNAGIQNRSGLIVDFNSVLDDAVSQVLSDPDIGLKSARRKSSLVPNLFSNKFEYAAPSDISGLKIIDIPPQLVGKNYDEWFLIPSRDFNMSRPLNSIAFDHYNAGNILKISANVDSSNIDIATLDSLTSGGGTWEAFGDATNVARDGDDYVKESGSVSFDINASGGTTAGIKNTNVNEFDITDYLNGNGSLFVYTRINSTTNITNYTLRIGTDESNYYTATVTTRNDGTALQSGWNLLRFDLTSLTETGTVTNTSINYIALFMTKSAAKVSETDYKFDSISIAIGKNYDLIYYTAYGWKNISGTYLETSASDTDFLVADREEFTKLFLPKAKQLALEEINDFNTAAKFEQTYQINKLEYIKGTPNEAMVFSNEYYGYEDYPHRSRRTN